MFFGAIVGYVVTVSESVYSLFLCKYSVLYNIYVSADVTGEEGS